VILNTAGEAEVIAFANKAGTFLHDTSPFKGKSTNGKGGAISKTASWLGRWARKAFAAPSKASKSDLANLCAWVWDHKLRKTAAKTKKWVWHDVNSAGALVAYLTSAEVTEDDAALAAASAKKGAAKKPRKAAAPAAAPRPPRKARAAPEALSVGAGLVKVGKVPLSGAKMFQDIYVDTPALATQMLTRVRQGAQKFQGKPLTGGGGRPPFSFKADKSPARESDLNSFEVTSDGIAYKVGPTAAVLQHEFSPAAIRTLYEKDGARCGPPQSGPLAQTSTIGNMNKAVEGLTRVMRAAQAPGSRMRPTSAVTIVATSEKVEGGAEQPRGSNLYLFEGGDPGGKERYDARYNHVDARATLLTKGVNLPSVNLEVDTTSGPAAAAAAPGVPPPGHDGMDVVHVKAMVSESVALTTTMLGLDPNRMLAEDLSIVGGVAPSVLRARAAVQRFNQAVVDMGLLPPHNLLE